LSFRDFCLLLIKTIDHLKNAYPEELKATLNHRIFRSFVDNIQKFNSSHKQSREDQTVGANKRQKKTEQKPALL
jgi:predicted DsbA family dithiol-disulfide isomerase